MKKQSESAKDNAKIIRNNCNCRNQIIDASLAYKKVRDEWKTPSTGSQPQQKVTSLCVFLSLIEVSSYIAFINEGNIQRH